MSLGHLMIFEDSDNLELFAVGEGRIVSGCLGLRVHGHALCLTFGAGLRCRLADAFCRATLSHMGCTACHVVHSCPTPIPSPTKRRLYMRWRQRTASQIPTNGYVALFKGQCGTDGFNRWTSVREVPNRNPWQGGLGRLRLKVAWTKSGTQLSETVEGNAIVMPRTSVSLGLSGRAASSDVWLRAPCQSVVSGITDKTASRTVPG